MEGERRHVSKGERQRISQGISAHQRAKRIHVVLCPFLIFDQFLLSFAAVDSTEDSPKPIPDCNLPSAIPKEMRSNVANAGQQMPLGVAKVGWASGEILGYIMMIIAEEVVGTNAHFSGMQTYSPGLVNMLVDPTHHISMEVWTSLSQLQVDQIIASTGPNAPQAVGKQDYMGKEGTFGHASTFENANLANPALFLEYYKCYNRSTFETSEYFTRIADIPTSRLSRCNESRLADPLEAELLGSIIGDWDGVEEVSVGTHYAPAGETRLMMKCLDGPTGHWWLAPACRHKPEECIPWLTGASYAIASCTQQAAAYNMPIACANAGTWGDYTRLPKEFSTLFYWWTPDSTFLDGGLQIQFPPKDKAQWAIGDKRTANEDVSLDTWVNANMSTISNRMLHVAKQFSLTKQQIDGLLTAVSSEFKMTMPQAACTWLKANEAVWRLWIPEKDQTECEAGKGLIHYGTQFVENRAIASSCEWCPGGHTSVEITDDRGRTHICQDTTGLTSKPTKKRRSRRSRGTRRNRKRKN